MDRPPRPRGEGVIRRRMLVPRLGLPRPASPPRSSWAASSSCSRGPAGIPATRSAPGSPLHHAYLQATTMTFLGIVACQIGTGVRGAAPSGRRCTVRDRDEPAAVVGHRIEFVIARGPGHDHAAAAHLPDRRYPPAAALRLPSIVRTHVWGADERERGRGPARKRDPRPSTFLGQRDDCVVYCRPLRHMGHGARPPSALTPAPGRDACRDTTPPRKPDGTRGEPE